MNNRYLNEDHLEKFRLYLVREEKSAATVEKYLRDVRTFFLFAENKEITKECVISYKKDLEEQNYAVRSINSMLASTNSFLKFMGWTDSIVKTIRMQRQIYCPEERELSKAEYVRLLNAAKGQQIQLIMQTICGTGIRISELQYFTVSAVKSGKVNVHCKSKTRTIFIPGKLKRHLLEYVRRRHIKDGAIFVTKNGKPVDRSNVWAKMKKLCKAAGVKATKVFPHNLRKLFARTFYKVDRDIAKLADILGHGSIETTRIYIMTTGEEHRRKIERLGLII